MNYLLSYPRSGNSYVRFLLESVTQMRTLDSAAVEDNIHNDYSKRSSLIQYKDKSKILARKEHQPSKIIEEKAESLMLLVRDPIEAMGSHCLRTGIKPSNTKRIEEEVENYMVCVRYYDRYKRAKHIIRYEDVVSDPFNIRETLEFLQLDIDLDNFHDKMTSIVSKSRETYHAGANSPQGSLHHYKQKYPRLAHAIYEAMSEHHSHPVLSRYFDDSPEVSKIAKRPGLIATLFS